MRTTVTLDDDLARELKDRARATGRSFKEVLNDAVQRGLNVGERPDAPTEPFRVEAKERGLRSGVDPLKLNQLYDDLETEDLGLEAGRGAHEP